MGVRWNGRAGRRVAIWRVAGPWSAVGGRLGLWGEPGEGAVEVAVEHVLVADEFEDFVCGGECGEEWLALAAEFFIALGVFDVVLEAGDSSVEALGVLLEPDDQEFVEVGCGECASEGGDGFGDVEELRAEAVGGIG